MGPDCVVVLTPFLHLHAGIVKRQEPMGVETLGPELAVERLDERVVDVGLFTLLSWTKVDTPRLDLATEFWDLYVSKTLSRRSGARGF